MPSATALIAYLGQRGRMGSAMGAFNSAMAFGLIIGPVLAGVAEDIGWAEHETVFWAAGIIGVTGSLIFLWLAGREKAAEARS
jgi:MFS family permease